MKKPRTIKLAYGERIVAVVPECCNGPGWSNTPAWVYIATNDGRLREECIQPDERTPELHTLFAAGYAMCNALAASVPSVKIKRPNIESEGAARLLAQLPSTDGLGGAVPPAPTFGGKEK